MDFVSRLLAREVLAGARLLRWIDDGLPEARETLKRLYPHAGRAMILGITGNPGSGKSTLTDQLIRRFRARGKTVAVVAVDPSSPFSGGAILGDRIRMQDHALDEGVFIRSFATRGHLGGLTNTTTDVVHALDAMGWEVVLIETVGVGQDEVEVQRLAHTTLVLMTPGMGDEIQAIKAGILEIADVFVVNKADREGADRTVRELEHMLDLGRGVRPTLAELMHHGGKVALAAAEEERVAPEAWVPRIVKTVAFRGEGIDGLMEAIDAHRAEYLRASQEPDFQRARLRQEFLEIYRRTLIARGWSYLMSEDHLGRIVDKMRTRVRDPYSLADEAVADLGARPPAPG
ncbi:MAG TPA: methylmalonyl Co-A mutase-associated GTPase MeaB [Myxococcota bacterium]|nr:methylmalonyl Co-A mutase-associated GTPase MeaB [Myxococcota bacterium]HRY93981.1 methylmalonyl Co-A mutase-associated GTPase MeaB [Myxococcota bacterium]HSA22694.1 methylmalonyl Co-A mutase-associated GTPase MeaB [Myxococcota bacterium]